MEVAVTTAMKLEIAVFNMGLGLQELLKGEGGFLAN